MNNKPLTKLLSIASFLLLASPLSAIAQELSHLQAKTDAEISDCFAVLEEGGSYWITADSSGAIKWYFYDADGGIRCWIDARDLED